MAGGSNGSFTMVGWLALALYLSRTVVLVDLDSMSASTLNPLLASVPLVVFYRGHHFEPGFYRCHRRLNRASYRSDTQALSGAFAKRLNREVRGRSSTKSNNHAVFDFGNGSTRSRAFKMVPSDLRGNFDAHQPSFHN